MENERLYSIGGLGIRFSGWLPPAEEGDNLPMFRAQNVRPDIEIRVRLTDSLDFPTQLVPEWEDPYVRSLKIGNEIHRYYRKDWDRAGADYAHLFYSADTPQFRTLELCNRGFALNEKQILATIGSEELFLHFGRAVLHSSCVEYNGQAILFSGVSGIGKSTQAGLWETYADATVKNGDRNLLCCFGEEEYVCGLPYAGTSGICTNFKLPIHALVVLGQGKTNTIRRLPQKEAVICILSQLPVQRWNADAVGKAMDMAIHVASHIPVYQLICLPDATAVELLKKTLAEET